MDRAKNKENCKFRWPLRKHAVKTVFLWLVHFDPLVKKMSDTNHLSGPLSIIVCDLCLVDFDPFCEFLCFKVRNPQKPSLSGDAYLQGWNLFKIFGILTSGFGHNKIASNEPWNTETQKTDRNPPITNHKQWPFEPVEENFRFLRGPLRWLTSDIFLTRGSKCTNHRKTVLIACFLRGHLNLLCSLFYVHFLWLVDFVRSSG